MINGTTKIFLNYYESNLRKYFTLIYKHYNKEPVEFLSTLEQQNIYLGRFYTFLCSFASNEEIAKLFEDAKTLVVKDLYYNQNFWHIKEGYIEEKNENLKNTKIVKTKN